MSLRKRIDSFGYAFKGIAVVVRTETNMKIHLVLTLVVVVAGFCFGITTTEWILCLLCMGLVLSMEMMNTALEAVVDLASPEIHPLAAKAKDVAAGAVLVCAIIAVVVGAIIFLPRIIQLI